MRNTEDGGTKAHARIDFGTPKMTAETGQAESIAAIIEAHALVKRFNRVAAVDHVSFAAPEGVVFGFLGPNGAGKTTAIKMLTTVLAPSEGKDHTMGASATSTTATPIIPAASWRTDRLQIIG